MNVPPFRYETCATNERSNEWAGQSPGAKAGKPKREVGRGETKTKVAVIHMKGNKRHAMK